MNCNVRKRMIMSKIRINPVVAVTITLGSPEVRHLKQWMK